MRIIQISDIHLLESKSGKLKGHNTYANFSKILKYINSNYKFDFLTITGDLSEDGTESSYQLLSKLLTNLLDKVIIIPGNHDNHKNLKLVFRKNLIKKVDLENISLHFLDSTAPDVIHGEFTNKEIDDLKQLINTEEKDSLVFLHHHPYLTGLNWLDRYNLKNHEYFIEEIAKNKKVKGIFHGHIHGDFVNKNFPAPIFSCPATSFTFEKREDSEYIRDEHGFNIIDIESNGIIKVEQILLSTSENV